MNDILDTLGMFDAAAALPEQVAAAAETARAVTGPLPDHDDIENVVVLGMGGSGIGGDLLREVAGPFMPVPVVVHKGYGIPNFIGEGSLVFALSFSGNTEETLEAASEAAAAGGRLVVVSNGGDLAELAEQWGAATVPVQEGIPMPRAAIGALSIPPLVVLETVGLFPGASAWVEAAVAQLRARRDELITEGNMAQRLARRIGRQLPIVYGGGGLGGLAALRWKNQFNENAKVPAFWNQLPELCHNELCGWGQHGDVTRQVFRLIELRHDYEHPQVMRRFDLVNEFVEEVVAAIEVVEAQGEGALAQLLDLVLIGDFVSLHLAALADVDPGPVPVLDLIKERLADGG
ncbi:bifunctional phosphoglucose/phosphomannose isomerase [Rhabdothermincola sediminis]|uniref:bifunctional phosphoglucose/phosphomannose isomerase n=1 Tax=Rhabdothermincola sediminis TaxID=2751370 RepID=UPI001AA09E39|nr:bifunctional phosphoglucose/phosphomannose isomerase [Rhabdothermincola sediminis]